MALLSPFDGLRIDHAALSAACFAILAPSGVSAEPVVTAPSDPPASEIRASAEPVVTPPSLITPAEARYPEQALARRLEATVRLALTLDAGGVVKHAEVVQGAGHGFDEAALEAAYRLVFSPARRGDQPVAVRILYEHEFRLPEGQNSPARPERPIPMQAPPPLAPRPSPASVDSTDASSVSQAGPSDAAPGADMEIVVRGLTTADQLRESARAVKVVETTKAKRESADMGQVLSRVEGVSVRRATGLGSEVRFSLNGLGGEQVRFFLDGVPLSLAGYPSGIANVPVNLVERVEIYSGVVPVQFGADALGGTVNLVTDHSVSGSKLTGSYQVGSFGTHRLSLTARNLHGPSGFFTRVEGFHDQSQNDYEVDVEDADELGRPYMARVSRFHDAYRASGGSLEFGFVNRPYAKRLLARVFLTDYDKEVQHNVVMTVPYGDVEFGETSYGASLRYAQPLGDDVELDLLTGYTRSVISYLDVGTCFYDWSGTCIIPDHSPGEIDSQPHDQLHYQGAFMGRANLSWQMLPLHALRLSVSPTLVSRTGDERRQPAGSPDPLDKDRTLTTLVGGVEWELDTPSDVLENITFVKAYAQWLRSDELVSGALEVTRKRDSLERGFGDSLRVRATEWLYFKASYEYAARLPSAYEVFGDGRFVKPALELGPERSHNANLGGVFESELPTFGSYRAGANLFLRDAHDQIVLIANERTSSYQNVLSARSQGIEGSLGWTAPGRMWTLDGNATYQSLRNTSSEGTFAPYEGDRLPNRPYFFANGSATFQLEALLDARDSLSLTWYTSYVHEFYRHWESIGQRDTKQVIDAQLTHTVALMHALSTRAAKVTSTFEVDNLTDARVFDFFGVQKPGRAFYVKTTLEL